MRLPSIPEANFNLAFASKLVSGEGQECQATGLDELG